MADTIRYVYGIVPATLDLGGAPPGIEDAPVRREADGDIAAVVSTLDASDYDALVVETRSADVDWITPRAVAHDRVLSWVSDRATGAVIPMHIFSLFRDDDSVRAMLRDRGASLQRALSHVGQGREYALRIYRLDATLATAIGSLSTRIAELERAASAASPGQRYLLERKLDAERKAEVRRVGGDVAREALALLREQSLASHVSPLPAGLSGDAPGAAVLNAAFLVAHDRLASFQAALTDVIARYASAGFHFDFTGPWPAYHFVAERE